MCDCGCGNIGGCGITVPFATGASGTIWRSGSGAPSNTLGVDGDFYLNTANGDVYTKTGGSYVLTTNITGATGAAGTNGIALLYSSPADVSCDGTNLDNIAATYTVPANTLATNGDYVQVECVSLGSGSKFARPAFITVGINAIQSGGVQQLAQNGNITKITSRIVRVSATTYSYDTVGHSLTTQPSISSQNTVSGVDFTQGMTITITMKKNGVATTSGSITVRNKTITLYKQ